jgi:hypothetical protein
MLVGLMGLGGLWGSVRLRLMGLGSLRGF